MHNMMKQSPSGKKQHIIWISYISAPICLLINILIEHLKGWNEYWVPEGFYPESCHPFSVVYQHFLCSSSCQVRMLSSRIQKWLRNSLHPQGLTEEVGDVYSNQSFHIFLNSADFKYLFPVLNHVIWKKDYL